jgi:hypothetical protein
MKSAAVVQQCMVSNRKRQRLFLRPSSVVVVGVEGRVLNLLHRTLYTNIILPQTQPYPYVRATLVLRTYHNHRSLVVRNKSIYYPTQLYQHPIRQCCYGIPYNTAVSSSSSSTNSINSNSNMNINMNIQKFSAASHDDVVSSSRPGNVSSKAAVSTNNKTTGSTTTLSTAPASRQSGDGYRELLRWTENILHPLRTPLGCMDRTSSSSSSTLWTDVLMAMQVWLGYKPPLTVEQLLENIMIASTSGDGNNNNNNNNNNINHAAVIIESQHPLIPRHVDLVDRLLTRLHYEQSAYFANASGRTHRQQLYYEHDQQLQLWTTITFQSWLTISKAFPDSPMALRKASIWYNKLNDIVWARQLLDDESDTQEKKKYQRVQQQKIPFFIAFVQAHQRLVDATGMKTIRSTACQTAVDMLLDEAAMETIVPNCTHIQHTNALKACYQLALQQCLELAAADNEASVADSQPPPADILSTTAATDFVSTASKIMEFMEKLAERPGWSDVRFQEKELDKVLDALFLDRIKDNARPEEKKRLSRFEREALQQRILTKINKAVTLKDQETVEEMVLYWRSNMQDEEKDTLEWKPFAQAVTNFYLRMQDPVKATKWMQIQDQMPSQEAIQQAILSTMTRPSIDIPENETDSVELSNFEELKALNRVFAENEQERIKQKRNLLDIWVTKVRSPIVPWRATEILESLESEKGVQLEAETYTTVVKLWLANSNDTTGVAAQKALDVAMRCPVFDMTLLTIITKLMVDRQLAGEKMNPQAISNIVSLIEEKFDNIPTDQIDLMILNTFQLLTAMPRSLEFLKFILDQGIEISSEIMNASVKSYSPNISLLLVLFDIETENQLTPDFHFYKASLHHLLSIPPTPQTLDRITQFFSDLMLKTKVDDSVDAMLDLAFQILKVVVTTADGESRAKLTLVDLERYYIKDPNFMPIVDGIPAMINESDYDVTVVEELSDPNITAPTQKVPVQQLISPIPLSFYKKTILLFGEKRMSKMIQFVYDRLKGHRHLGYYELEPDQSSCGVYMKVLKEVDGLNSLDQRIDQLHELIGRFEATDCENTLYKPQYIWFDITIGDLHERSKKTAMEVLKTPKKGDPYERDSRAAVKLLDKMHTLRIVPNNLERVYPYNIAMELILNCRNQHMHFKIVSDLKQQMDDLGLISNSYTMTLILKSCERAITSKNFAALTTMVECLTHMRQMGKAHPAVYMQCFKLFQAKRALSDREFVIAEKMMATIFQCCTDDGMLNNPVRHLFKVVALPMTFKRTYFDRLENGSEPADWSRNANKVV